LQFQPECRLDQLGRNFKQLYRQGEKLLVRQSAMAIVHRLGERKGEHSNGVGTPRAVRIYKTYGADAIRLISENPYHLARDIPDTANDGRSPEAK
jgi:hypothetical protein